jgi:hypothetical protein
MIRTFAMGTLLILMVSHLTACSTAQKQPSGADGAKNDGHSDSLNAASSLETPSGGQIGNSGEPLDPFEHFK